MGYLTLSNCSVEDFFKRSTEAHMRKWAGAVIYNRGQSYAHEHIITRWEMEDGRVSAVVAGSRPYQVVAQLDADKDLDIRCGCPYHDTCKHIVGFWKLGQKKIEELSLSSAPVVEVKHVDMHPFWGEYTYFESIVLTMLAISGGSVSTRTISLWATEINKLLPFGEVSFSVVTKAVTHLMQLQVVTGSQDSSFRLVKKGFEHKILKHMAAHERKRFGLYIVVGFKLRHVAQYGYSSSFQELRMIERRESFLLIYVDPADKLLLDWITELLKTLYIETNYFDAILNDLPFATALPPVVQKVIVLISNKNRTFFLPNSRMVEALIYPHFTSSTGDAELDAMATIAVFEVAAFKGDVPMIEKIIAHGKDSIIGLVGSLWLRMIKGEYEGLAAMVEASVKIYRKASQDGLLPKPLTPFWFLRIFIDLREKVDGETVGRHIKHLRTCGILPSNFNELTEGLSLYAQNMRNEAAEKLSFESGGLLLSIFCEVMVTWISPKWSSKVRIDSLKKFINRDNYPWLNRELALILLKIGQSEENRLIEAREDEVKYGWGQAWADYSETVADWKQSLQALLSLGTDAVQAPNRVIWLFDSERNILNLKEQKRQKTGWSLGKTMDVTGYRLGKFFDQDDLRIKGAAGSDYGHWDIKIPVGKVALELVGHPRIFLAESPQTQVHFIEEPIMLTLKEGDDGQIDMRFNVAFEVNDRFVLVRETPTRYKVYVVQKSHVNVLRAMNGHKIMLPQEAKDEVAKAIEHISNFVEVQSSVTEVGGSIPEVETDARIYIQLVPIGMGFMMELFVKPLPPVTAYSNPGKGEATIYGLLDDRSRVFGVRNLAQEKENFDALVAEVAILQEVVPNDNAWFFSSEDVCLEFLLEVHPLVNKGQVVVEWPKGESFRITHIADKDALHIEIEPKEDWFELEGVLKADDDTILTMQELLNQVNLYGRFVQLSPGKFMALTKEFEKRLAALDAMTRRTAEGDLQIHPLTVGAFDELLEGLPNVVVDNRWRERVEFIKKVGERKYNLPQGVNADLRDYQKEGYKWLCRLADWGVGACLADDMGLGKTLQVQALLLKRAKQGPALVVAPASVVRNWVNEINRFTPGLQPILFGEGDRAETLNIVNSGDVLIVTYGLLQREAELFADKKFSTIVLDEAQAIKNAQTKRSEIVKTLQADFKIITTGTPLENHLGELWSLFEFINPGLLGAPDYFARQFIGPIERDKDPKRLESLRKLVQPFILRRLKKDHLKELPEKTEITLTVELTREEAAFYEALRRTAIERIEALSDDSGGQRNMRVLAEITRLRQCCCNPRLVDENIILPCSKLRLFDETVTELLENGHRALVFSQFVSHLTLLREHLDDKNINYQYLDGSTPTKKRQEAIDNFQAGKGELFLISLKAGGAGINLTGADYVIHMDPWWNPAVEDQATDRAHRMGQKRPVTVYRLITAGTIEEKIVRLHEHKRDLADSLLSGADVSARLTTNDLVDLLKNK